MGTSDGLLDLDLVIVIPSLDGPLRLLDLADGLNILLGVEVPAKILIQTHNISSHLEGVELRGFCREWEKTTITEGYRLEFQETEKWSTGEEFRCVFPSKIQILFAFPSIAEFDR